MESMIHIGTNADDAKATIDHLSVAIINVLGAAEVHRNPEVTIKALDVLASVCPDFSVSGTVISNNAFTNQHPAPVGAPKNTWPKDIPMGHWPDDDVDEAAEEE